MKINFLFLFAAFIAINFCSTQKILAQKQGKELVDSLLIELPKAKEDTNKVKLLDQLCFEYKSININIGLKYGEECLKLANKLQWKRGLCKIYKNLGYYQSNPIDYFLKSLYYAEELNDKEMISILTSNIGTTYETKGNYTKALEYFRKALKIDEEIGRKRGIGFNNYYIARTYMMLDDPVQSLDYYLKSLKIFEQIGEKKGLAANYYGIGQVYQNLMKNLTKALEYYQKALIIDEELGYYQQIAVLLNSISSIYTRMGKNDIALDYALRAMNINEKVYGAGKPTYDSYISIASIYLEKQNLSKALEYYNLALSITEKLENKHLYIDILGYIGMVYYSYAIDTNLKSENNRKIYYQKALEKFEQYNDYHNENNLKHAEVFYLPYISECYSKLGKFKEALKYYKLYKAVEDSAYSLKNTELITKLESSYKFEKQEKQNAILKLEINKAKTYRNYLIIGIILIIFITFAVILRYLNKRKQNKILEQKNFLLAEANDALDKTYKEKILIQEESHSKEKEIIALKNEKLETELEMKAKELATLAVNLVEKNEYLLKIKEDTELILKAKPDEVAPLARMIIRSININASSEESWQVFETQFKTIHRGFMEFLAISYPELTVTELKVCALLKINLSTKEISSLLNLSVRTIEDRRFDIRKKLGLDANVNLNLFITQLVVNQDSIQDANGNANTL